MIVIGGNFSGFAEFWVYCWVWSICISGCELFFGCSLHFAGLLIFGENSRFRFWGNVAGICRIWMYYWVCSIYISGSPLFLRLWALFGCSLHFGRVEYLGKNEVCFGAVLELRGNLVGILLNFDFWVYCWVCSMYNSVSPLFLRIASLLCLQFTFCTCCTSG